MKSISHIILLLWISITLCSAQSDYIPGNLIVRNYPPKEYGANYQNWDVIQDSRGIMYFANISGVLEFDGKNWEIILVKNNLPTFSLAIDKSGVIYVGAPGEFGYLSITSKGQKKYVSLKGKIPKGHENFSTIWSIIPTEHGIYFSSREKVFRFYKNKITIIDAELAPLKYLVYSKLFVNGTSGIEILKGNSTIYLPGTEELIFGKHSMVHVLPFKDDKLLLVSRKFGLYIYDYNSYKKSESQKREGQLYKKQKVLLKKFHTECDDYFRKHEIYTCCRINEKIYALGTSSGGVVIINNEGKLVSLIKRKNGLIDNKIRKLYVDKQQNIWAATNNGISQIHISSPFTVFDKNNGLNTSTIKAFYYNKRLYVSTYNACFYLSDYDKLLIDGVHTLKPFLNNGTWSFTVIRGQLIAGTHKGLYHINDTNSKKIMDWPNVIYATGQSEKFSDHLFFGGEKFLKVIKLKFPKSGSNNMENQWVRINDGGKNIVSECKYDIRKIISDANGNLWISTERNGIIYIKFLSDKISDYKVFELDTLNGLPSNNFNIVHFHNNKIIVGTKAGIYNVGFTDTNLRFNKSSINFVPYNKFNVLNKDSIETRELGFSKDKIWFSSGKEGGFLYKKDDDYKLDKKPFYELIGTIESLYVDSTEIVWYSCNDGLYRFDRNKNKNYEIPYSSLIRKVTINADSIIFSGSYFNDSILIDSNIVNTSLLQNSELIPVLQYRDNDIAFEYSTCFYEYDDKIMYKVILDGYDKDTSEWTFETKKEYTNLPAGSYSFKVKAKNIFDHESKISTYKFTVLAPWYQTWWAYLLYLVLLVLLIIVIVKLNLKRLKDINLKLEKLVEERTQEIREKSIEINEKNAEITVQNEELLQSKNEIELQRDAIEQQNIELAKLSIVASETSNAVMILDAEGRFLWFNKSFTELFGYTFDEYKSKYNNSFIKASKNEKISEKIDKALKLGKPQSYISKNITKSGKELWMHTSLSPVTDIDNKIINLIAIDTDITKLKNAEEQIKKQNNEISEQARILKKTNEKLKKLDEFKEEMTAMIVHDLKNPLNSIIGLAENDIVKQAGNHMLNLVMNILDVHKYENTDIKLQKGFRSVLDISKLALEQVNLLYKQKNITVENKIEGFYVDVDQDIIVRIFVNLLTNAIKYSPINGKIVLESKKHTEDLIIIKVTDNGPGISQDEIDTVFIKFEQVVAKKAGLARSTGIGLTFCKLFIEAHGCEIGIESEIGKSTTIWFTLPLKGYKSSDIKQVNVEVNSKIELSKADKEILRPYFERLKNFEVYESSDVERILNNIDFENSENLKKWKKEMDNSLYSMNQEKYVELIAMISKIY